MTEPTASDSWLYSRLSNDPTLIGLVGGPSGLRIHFGTAPLKTPFPHLVYQFQSGHDVAGVNAVRIMDQEVYLVKGVDREESLATVKAIASRIDALLHKARGQTIDGHVLACVREQPFKMAEIVDGAKYLHLGGIYRVFVAG